MWRKWKVSKPREFWIDKVTFDLNWRKVWVAEHPHKDTLASPCIHVIEKSAYDELKAEFVKLQKTHQEAWKAFSNHIGENHESFMDGMRSLANKELKRKLDIAVEALTKLTNERAAAYGKQYNALECPGAKALEEIRGE